MKHDVLINYGIIHENCSIMGKYNDQVILIMRTIANPSG